jgi:hypothetical protein
MRIFITCILRQKYNYNNQVNEDEIGMACSTYEEKNECINGLVGEPEGKRPLGRPRCRWRIILRWITEEQNWVM